MPQTETLDKFYLEWSQFTKARTSRDLALDELISAIQDFKSHLWIQHVMHIPLESRENLEKAIAIGRKELE